VTTSGPPDGEEVNLALREAIEGVLGRFGELPLRWVLIAEAYGSSDGERGLWLAGSADLKPWDVLGMATYLDALERARIAARETGGG